MPNAYSRAAKAQDDSNSIRLQKLLAQAGFGSRRKCEDMITEGRVEVDGELVTELGTRVDPHKQQVRVDGSRVRVNPNHVTLALNKPRKVLSARRKKLENRVGNAVTRAVGGVFDGMVEGLNQTVLRGHRIEHHAMARISAAWDGAMDAISQMSHTMSYGLLLFGLGLCVTLLYLMFY